MKKKRSGVKFPIWFSTINCLRARAKWFPIGECNTSLETFLWRLQDIALACSKYACFEEDTSVQNFSTTRIPLWNSGTKCHLDVALAKSHILYHREDNDWRTPKFLDRFKCEFEMKHNKKKRVGARSLACSILGG
jgi:hypothetical protein